MVQNIITKQNEFFKEHLYRLYQIQVQTAQQTESVRVDLQRHWHCDFELLRNFTSSLQYAEIAENPVNFAPNEMKWNIEEISNEQGGVDAVFLPVWLMHSHPDTQNQASFEVHMQLQSQEVSNNPFANKNSNSFA